MSDASSLDDNTRGLAEAYDNPLERLRLLSGDDDAIAAFLDSLDVDSPRERELLPSSPGRQSWRDPSGSTTTTGG